MVAPTPDPNDLRVSLANIRARASFNQYLVTQHAQQEMTEDNVLLDHLLQTIATAELLENYPTHRRGPCCLLHGTTAAGRHLHIVCTTVQPVLIIITVYEPKPPKWPTPTERRPQP